MKVRMSPPAKTIDGIEVSDALGMAIIKRAARKGMAYFTSR